MQYFSRALLFKKYDTYYRLNREDIFKLETSSVKRIALVFKVSKRQTGIYNLYNKGTGVTIGHFL
jgi:hypothetical protein